MIDDAVDINILEGFIRIVVEEGRPERIERMARRSLKSTCPEKET